MAVGAAGAWAADAQLGRVEVQGEAAIAREKKTLAQLFKAQALFEKYHALAPAAALKFKVYARTQAESAQRLELALVTPAGRQPVPLDDEDRFVIDPAWRVLDERIELRSRLGDGRVTWRPDIRTPGVAEGERRLGDLRLQCRVGFGSGVARGSSWFGGLLSFSFDDCWDPDWSPSNFADRPVFAVTLVHGERRRVLGARLLHGLRDDGGPDYDWGYSLRERMFRLPIGDTSWPDDTRVVFEAMDDPPAPPDPAVQALPQSWAKAALALSPGLSPAEVAERMGAARDDLRFESGRRLQRHLHEIGTPDQPRQLELVTLFDAEDRLLKSSLRRLAPPVKR
ncbi:MULTISPECIES: hypothetical protein [unclassified Roseateles]|uniref:hypothetical protein n=1 Tax=unclassified Roseateles TaxID=2626991 RepID=UPI0006FC335E|nr:MULTISPECIES: hypothetical protein [unclassified Roseateles]KQW51274.1 hypothetical protein ASC81_01080 [Pelomonas sp. Root405]KRA77506.1 hypothetical protein ASD88_01080 [Pelomonas sp. Root662]